MSIFGHKVSQTRHQSQGSWHPDSTICTAVAELFCRGCKILRQVVRILPSHFRSRVIFIRKFTWPLNVMAKFSQRAIHFAPATAVHAKRWLCVNQHTKRTPDMVWQGRWRTIDPDHILKVHSSETGDTKLWKEPLISGRGYFSCSSEGKWFKVRHSNFSFKGLAGSRNQLSL